MAMGPIEEGMIETCCSTSAAAHLGLKSAVLKHINGLGAREGLTGVAFPPPLALAKVFSPSGCGRIFALFSKVMRVGLSTGPGAKGPGSGLSGPIFSGPDDCAGLVNFF